MSNTMNYLVIATIGTFAALPAMAQNDASNIPPSAGSDTEIEVGGGAIISPRYPGSGALEVRPIPLINARTGVGTGGTLYLRGTEAGYDQLISDRVSVGVVGNYRFERDDDAAELSGMQDVDGAFEVGPKVRAQVTPNWGVEAKALADVSGAHDGYTARLGTDYRTKLTDRVDSFATVGLNYGSEDFNNAYYGVRPGEARPGRPAYSPDGGISHVDAMVGGSYALNPCWKLKAGVGADVLVGDVADSPLVEREIQPKMLVGLSYTF
jgi:outer membrane protein